MNTPASLRRLLPAFVTLALSLVALALPAQAQSGGTGTIQGRVYNPSSQQYVRSAEVRLEGTNQVAYTEHDGSFQFVNVPAGTQTVSIAFAGYTTMKETFNVAAGQVASREINLTSTAAPTEGNKEGVVKLEAFTVASQREGNSKAIMEQRRNMNIITSVSADIFGDVTDGNVGEFLKYLPGVDLDYVESEARGPRLGGMDGQYVGVSFDGMRSASADANRGGGAASRATSFEGFSITSIDSIEINRTASPENDADSPAGTVNMKTKRAFDRKGRRFDYNVGANFNSNDFTLSNRIHPGEHAQYQWKPNWQFTYGESFFDQKFGILAGYNRGWSLTEQTTETMDINNSPTAADPRPQVVRQIDYKDGPKWIRKDALLLTADWKVTPRLTVSMNMIYSYYAGDFWNRNFTFVAANSNANVINGRSTVRGDGVLTVIAPRDLSKPTNTATVDNGNNGVAALNWGGGGADKMTWTRQYSPRFEYKLGSLTLDGSAAYSKSLNHYEGLITGFSTAEVGGVASGWIATRPNPQSWEWTIRQTSGADWFNMNSFTSTNAQTGGTSIQDRTETWSTEKWTAMANAQWTLPWLQQFPTKIKFGGKWDEENRLNHNWNTTAKWAYIGPGGDTVTYNPATQVFAITGFGNWANLGPQYISPLKFDNKTTNMMTIYNINGVQGMPPRPSRTLPADLYHAHPELFVQTYTVDDYYNAYIANERNFRQDITAAYAQADTRVTSKLQIRFGVRMEQTKNTFKEFDPYTSAEMLKSPFASQFTKNATTGIVTPSRATSIDGINYQYKSKPRVTRESQYHNYFPSLLAKYNFTPNLEWQAGINRGISRPAIDDLTGLWVNDEQNQIVSVPNPTLQPEKHTVIQSRLGYYFGSRSPGQVSIAVIQDTIKNFTVSNTYSAADWYALLGEEVDPDYSTYMFKTKKTVTDGQRVFRNLDLNYQQTLGFLPSEYLRGIGVGATFSRSYNTFTGASYRVNNQAPFRATGRLSYKLRRFEGALGIVWRDDATDTTDTYGRYWGAMTKFDFNASYRLTNHASLYVQARNITNVKDLYYYSPPGVREGQQGSLRSMEQYGANWVFGVKGTF